MGPNVIKIYFSLLLRHVEVTDITKKKSYRFLAGRWLSAYKCDGRVDCILPAACEEKDLKRFSYVFSENTKNSLQDTHLHWSILLRPPTSVFTRCQRLAVVVSTLLCSMTSSAIFYKSLPLKSATYENGAFNLKIGLKQVWFLFRVLHFIGLSMIKSFVSSVLSFWNIGCQ